ncbi:MAG TPA: PfkB family carbohydrate kinase [Candidatus Saccharimonas sp.]|nr:PfkB family carbohydrate kinase [Candidatus Saccharimonas sp.]
MDTLVLVIGSPNTDIVTTCGRKTIIGPGGKARNIAHMTANLLSKGQVALVGRTSKDSLGLWKIPLDALKSSGVNIDFLTIDETSKELPGIALIATDTTGESRVTFLPGATKKFNRRDIDVADMLFKNVTGNKGYVVFTLECPFDTLRYAIQKANSLNLSIIIDCGGFCTNVRPNVVRSILGKGVFFIKPNAYEAQCITGVKIRNFASAQKAANILRSMGAQNILITAGKKGAYLFTNKQQTHIRPPKILGNKDIFDSTGCGDQALAVICASLVKGVSIEEAARPAILAATLQFYKRGVRPITRQEFMRIESAQQKTALSFA